jgi:glycosyltransferase involved in cell wall biosynthesis
MSKSSTSRKSMHGTAPKGNDPGEETARIDPELLVRMDRGVIEALTKAELSGLGNLLETLAANGESEAAHSLLSNIPLDGYSRERKYELIKAALGARNHKAHDWIIDYGIAGARAKMIESTILPYVSKHHSDKTLFRGLKEYEMSTLLTGSPLINPQYLREVILAAQNGNPIPTALPTPIGEPAIEHRVVMPNVLFSTLLRLAWLSQHHLFELAERYEGDAFIDALTSLKTIVPSYLVCTHLGYPMGGGESFVHQTCQILVEFGVRCIWLSFFDPLLGAYTEASTTHTPYYIDVRKAGANCDADIRHAIEQYAPDLVHSHGGTNEIVMRLSQSMRFRAMVGYHFWNGLIELGETRNQHIRDNLEKHSLATFKEGPSDTVIRYVASEFMHDVYRELGGSDSLEIIHPVSDPSQFMAQRTGAGKFVLQVNIATLKGGRIFQSAVRKLGDHIPFLGVQTEPEDSSLYDEVREDMTSKPLCVVQGYGSVREFYRQARLVMVPTLVDETFCRVAYEAAMNGIPVISTRNGFLPQMFGDTGFYLDENPESWINTIARLYENTQLLESIGRRQQEWLVSSFGAGASSFMSMTMRLIDDSIRKNIGIFTMWGDQGLGNLSHTHAKLLRSMGYKVHIFSFQPYSALGRALTRQRDPVDWTAPKHADSVYYSFNCREEVTANELSQFILANKIHILLVPEICWNKNWARLFDLSVANLKICAIPMAEIVLKDEALLHNRLTSTLFCTRIAESTLQKIGVTNGGFLGHGFQQALPAQRARQKRDRLRQRSKLKFLHVAGHNPNVRKNTRHVIEAFMMALESREDIELTVTSMDPVKTYFPEKIPPGIHIVDRPLSRDDILQMYEDHDVSIQVSSHEGLGLGFYESVSRNTPVLSLQAPPHNEIVLQDQTGWLIPAWPIPPADNEQSIVPAWRFHTSDLAFQILLLDKHRVEAVMERCGEVYKEQFDETSLAIRMLQVLPA